MQFDRGYLSPYMVTDPERMEAVLEDCLVLISREEAQRHEGHAPAPRAGGPVGQAPPDHRRGRGGRGPGHPRGQQAARHPLVLRGEGAGLRRPPQGHAGRHRDPDRGQGHHRGPGHQAREPQAGGPGHGPRRWSSTRTTPPSSTARARPRRSRAASSRSGPRSRRPPRTTTGRSSRSGSPSWPAASPSSRWAPRPRPP